MDLTHNAGLVRPSLAKKIGRPPSVSRPWGTTLWKSSRLFDRVFLLFDSDWDGKRTCRAMRAH